MTSASDIAAAIGPPLLRTVVDGARQQVRDVFLAEPHEPALAAEPGDLVLGVGLEGPEQALSLVRRCSDVRASGLVLRTALAGEPLVTTAAEQSGLTLLEIGEGVSWAHLVWLVTSIVDRSVPSGGSSAPGVHNDMFALADTVAAIVDAPVTIEDNRSRVLAYSSGQGHTDTARVATIVGRRVPEDVAAHYRSLGVFRRLASSDEPFVVPEGPDGIRPRLIVPVRAGGEWLGSIWIVVEDTVPDDVMADLRKAASVLTLHLLRLRAQSDVARRSAIDLLRSVLWQYSPEKAAGLDLPGPEPWRVVALRAPTDDIGADESVHLWQTVMQRHGWASPGLADLDGVALAVVGNGTAPGSWEWLRQLVAQAARPPWRNCRAPGPKPWSSSDCMKPAW